MMKQTLATYLAFAACAVAVGTAVACGGSATRGTSADSVAVDAPQVAVPTFNADSAYEYVRVQTAFGPRIPGSNAHGQCRRWLVQTLQRSGADTVLTQTGLMPDAQNKPLEIHNIIARFGQDKQTRLLLLAHYDTRPVADADPDPARRTQPFDGANDGASGVGVLLELARIIGQTSPQIGVDILLTDAEDSGISSDGNDPAADLTWCLGTQYFVNHPPMPSLVKPAGAILLDMVGAKDAVFRQEYYSSQAAPRLMQLVWDAAEDAGYGSRFDKALGGAVNDDHVHLIAAGIPAIDIIELGHPQTGSFHPSWHTSADNISIIDTATLAAVGNTMARVIYSYPEK